LEENFYMKAYHIYLLRHGMTEGNKKGQYIGSTDMPLCEEGKQQIKELAEAYVYPIADLFYSSPLQRCVKTLKMLYPDATIQLLPKLAECNFGDYEGKTFEELKELEDYKNWVAGAGKAAPPNGESGPEFQARCCVGFAEVVEQLLRSGKQKAVIVAHGGTIMSILSTFGYPRRQFYDWMSGNGKGFEVIITPQIWMNSKVIEVAEILPYEAEQNDNLEAYNAMIDELKDPEFVE
jgi:alpha-ribazole phosphatase